MFSLMAHQDRNSIQTTKRASEALERVHARTQLPKKVIAERVCIFLDENEELAALILGMVPGTLALDVARAFIDKLEKKPNARKAG